MTTSLPARLPINLLVLDQYPIFAQLQLEEALLRTDHNNWLILNRGNSPVIVMGISGKPETLLDPILIKTKPIPVIKRFSGGGTVITDHNTLFATWICNSSQTNVACCPQKIHQQIAKFYEQAFPNLNMALKENDYVIGERKWGGNAQYLCKDRWLHHTSMLWDYHPDQMHYLLMPAKRPAYRQHRNHEEFLCCLSPHFQDRSQVHQHIQQLLHQQFEVRQYSLEQSLEALQRPHRKATELLIT